MSRRSLTFLATAAVCTVLDFCSCDSYVILQDRHDKIGTLQRKSSTRFPGLHLEDQAQVENVVRYKRQLPTVVDTLRRASRGDIHRKGTQRPAIVKRTRPTQLPSLTTLVPTRPLTAVTEAPQLSVTHAPTGCRLVNKTVEIRRRKKNCETVTVQVSGCEGPCLSRVKLKYRGGLAYQNAKCRSCQPVWDDLHVKKVIQRCYNAAGRPHLVQITLPHAISCHCGPCTHTYRTPLPSRRRIPN